MKAIHAANIMSTVTCGATTVMMLRSPTMARQASNHPYSTRQPGPPSVDEGGPAPIGEVSRTLY